MYEKGDSNYMETFIFAANTVAPVVLITALGYFLKRIGMCRGEFAAQLNRICFRVFIPVMLFMNVYDGGGLQKSDLPLAVFSVVAIVAVFLLGMLLVRLFISEPKQKGVVLQCVLRSNFAIIGLPLASSLAGAEGERLAAVVSAVAIPTFNVLSVIALTMYLPTEERSEKPQVGRILLGIAKNPLIIGVVAGLVALGIQSLLGSFGINLRLSDATALYSAMQSIKAVTTPMALIALGAQFEFSAVRGLIKPIIVGTIGRLVLAPCLVIGSAFAFCPQFGAGEYALLVALCASPVAVSSAVMAAEMGSDGELAGQYVVWTTVFSTFSVFLLVIILRSTGTV